MGLGALDLDKGDSIENKVISLEGDIERLNGEVEELKNKYIEVITILLSLNKDVINEDVRKQIVILKDSIANKTTRIIEI